MVKIAGEGEPVKTYLTVYVQMAIGKNTTLKARESR